MDESTDKQRVSVLRLTVVVLGVVIALGAAYLVFVGPPKFASANPETIFAGYVDVTTEPTYHFETPVSQATSDVILAFVVADKTMPCEPSWGAAATLDQAATKFDIDRRIAQLRLGGGNVRVSFGGQANSELGTVCADEAALVRAYRSVIDRYRLGSIDVDLEGTALTDEASLVRRAQALHTVQQDLAAANRPVEIWLTLPVSLNGLEPAGLHAVDVMLTAGVELAGVNAMTMNFGTGLPPDTDMSNASEQAVSKLNSQLITLYGNHGRELSESQAWRQIGMTPMIGQNDVPGERFTIGDAGSVNAFALKRQLGMLSMWSLNRDQTCGLPLPKVSDVVYNTCSGVDQSGKSFSETLWQGTKVPAFPEQSPGSLAGQPAPSGSGSGSASASGAAAGSGSSGASSSSSGASASALPSVTGGPEDAYDSSPYVIWDSAVAYPVNTKVVWHQQVYQAKRWTSGFAPDTQVAKPEDTPWRLLGPVLPGESPAPLPTLPPGTYPQWSAATQYQAGARVQVDLVPYQAKWFTQGQKPDPKGGSKSPWALVSQ